MKLYISIKTMTFEDSIEHKIISRISVEDFLCRDEIIDLVDDDKFIKDTLKVEYKKDKDGNDTNEIENEFFVIKEQDTWWNFPLYELKDGKIIDFDYTKYAYFADTDRRMALADKISKAYNGSAEMKLQRKAIKKILDHLGIVDESFENYNEKIEAIINKNPK